MTAVSLISRSLAIHAAIGLAAGIAFVAVGASRVLPGSLSFKPGAAALWPHVLMHRATCAYRCGFHRGTLPPGTPASIGLRPARAEERQHGG